MRFVILQYLESPKNCNIVYYFCLKAPFPTVGAWRRLFNQSVSHKAVCRTALATPPVTSYWLPVTGLLMIIIKAESLTWKYWSAKHRKKFNDLNTLLLFFTTFCSPALLESSQSYLLDISVFHKFTFLVTTVL